MNWIRIYKTTMAFEAEIMKGKLEDAGIPCIIMNQRDSAYGVFGDIHVEVPEEMAEDAKRILELNTL
jgi:Putative prokaryotic signal transducing protein